MVIEREADHTRIHAAISAAEREVAVNIYLVSVASSSRYRRFAMLHALISALIAGVVPLILFPDLSGREIVNIELACALLSLACLQNRWFRQELVPNVTLKKTAWTKARLTWAHIRLQAQDDRPLLLLYCSKLERTAEIVAEQRILDRVPEAIWQRIIADFIPHMRAKDEPAAFVHLIEASHKALAPHFPANG